MKYGLIALLLFGMVNLHAQVFHFNDSSTTLIKTTDQTPAHWYLEIENDCGTDTMLRWKSHFVNCPPEWEINFDTQGGYFFPVLDGDSADFILQDTLDSPQKLIIGNHTNNTPGHGSVFFDIYDPNFPGYVTTIEYEFIITLVGIDEPTIADLIKILPHEIQLLNEGIHSLAIHDISGRQVSFQQYFQSIPILHLPMGMYMLQFELNGKPYLMKFMH